MSNIQWTDDTSNPIRLLKEDGTLGGHWCRKVSPGCANCYAESINNNGFFSFASHRKYAGEAPKLGLDRKELEKWTRARTSKKVFVGSMTDLFGDWVPRDWHFEIFDAAANSKLTFQFLTKRPDIMRSSCADWLSKRGEDKLPGNFWMGSSVENQRAASVRLPHLTQIPAGVIFLSCEPLLEEVTLGGYINSIDWVIIGGESGRGARPCQVDWIRSLIRQCQQERTNNPAVFVKQLGAKPVFEATDYPIHLADSKGGDVNEFPEDLKLRQFPFPLTLVTTAV
jgi:protein gp37